MPDVAPRLDVDVGRALLERVLPQPVDDVDDVLVVGVELAVLAELDQLLEVARERDRRPCDVSCAFFIDRARL